MLPTNGVEVAVKVGVTVGVMVDVGVAVGIGVGVRVGVFAAAGVAVGVTPGPREPVGVGSAVSAFVGEAVGVGVGALVAVPAVVSGVGIRASKATAHPTMLLVDPPVAVRLIEMKSLAAMLTGVGTGTQVVALAANVHCRVPQAGEVVLPVQNLTVGGIGAGVADVQQAIAEATPARGIGAMAEDSVVELPNQFMNSVVD